MVSGVAFTFGGCAVIGDAGDDGSDELVQTAGESVIMCHFNDQVGFSDIMVDGTSVSQHLDDGDTIGTCSAMMCGGS